ncbi:MAG: NAD-dependent epimerase/dehydratase family protein [Bacteroidota bacterium]
MSVLLTGATGRIGIIFARRLAQDGVPMRALVRETSDTSELDALGAESIVAHFDDEAGLARAVEGCEVVYHLAVSRDASGAGSAQAVNVDGTERLARAAARAGVSRFVHASTLGVYGLVTGGVVDEHRPPRPNTLYRQTKLEGEVAVRRVEAETNLPVTIVRIPKVVGAGAVRWAGFYRAVANQQIRLVGNGANRIQPVHNTDLVEALIRCGAASAAAGETYALAGPEAVSLRRFADLVAEELGVPPPPPGPPALLHRLYLEAEDRLFRWTGRTLRGAHQRELFVLDRATSTAKAERDFGYAPSWAIEDSIHQMAEDFRQRELIPRV